VVVAGDWLDERERLLQLSSYPTTTTPTTTTTTTTTTDQFIAAVNQSMSIIKVA